MARRVQEVERVYPEVTISDLVHKEYKEFWLFANKNRNAFDPIEQLTTVSRRIIYAGYKLGMHNNMNHDVKITTLMGEVMKYHSSGDDSINNSIKNLCVKWDTQPAVRMLVGVGNAGAYPGDEGSAARYLSVMPTPLFKAICRDMKYNDFCEDNGAEQPETISCPLPIMLIAGNNRIGIGKSAFFAERDAREIIEWISKDCEGELPKPTSYRGCKVFEDNGYVFTQSVVDTESDKRYDIVRNIPHTVGFDMTFYRLNKATDGKTLDGSGKGEKCCIMVPKGVINDKDLFKLGLLKGRQEQPYIWDRKIMNIRLSNHKEIALMWLDGRKKIVDKRLREERVGLEYIIHKINLIKKYVENDCSTWKSEKIIEFFGQEDASIVLNTPARQFLPENLAKNEITRKETEKEIEDIDNKLKNIKDVIIQEAYDIIEEQEKFYENIPD